MKIEIIPDDSNRKSVRGVTNLATITLTVESTGSHTVAFEFPDGQGMAITIDASQNTRRVNLELSSGSGERVFAGTPEQFINRFSIADMAQKLYGMGNEVDTDY